MNGVLGLVHSLIPYLNIPDAEVLCGSYLHLQEYGWAGKPDLWESTRARMAEGTKAQAAEKRGSGE